MFPPFAMLAIQWRCFQPNAHGGGSREDEDGSSAAGRSFGSVMGGIHSLDSKSACRLPFKRQLDASLSPCLTQGQL